MEFWSINRTTIKKGNMYLISKQTQKRWYINKEFNSVMRIIFKKWWTIIMEGLVKKSYFKIAINLSGRSAHNASSLLHHTNFFSQRICWSSRENHKKILAERHIQIWDFFLNWECNWPSELERREKFSDLQVKNICLDGRWYCRSPLL